MLIYVKIILKNFEFMLIYSNKKKCFSSDRRTDGQTHVQLKTIVRNLTIQKKNFYEQPKTIVRNLTIDRKNRQQ